MTKAERAIVNYGVHALNADPARVGRPYREIERPPYVESECGLTVHKTLFVRTNDLGWEFAVFKCGDGTFYPHYHRRRPDLRNRPRMRFCKHCI